MKAKTDNTTETQSALAALGWMLSPTEGWGFPPHSCEAVEIPPIATLIQQWRESMTQAREEIKQWRKDFNAECSRGGSSSTFYNNEDPRYLAVLLDHDRGPVGAEGVGR